MKTTVNIPEAELDDVMRFTRAATKREAIVTAIAEYNRRRRMAALVEHAAHKELKRAAAVRGARVTRGLARP